MISFSGCHYPHKIILQCARWYVAYGISYRDLEEMMDERGFEIDHSTLNRWVTNPMTGFKRFSSASATIAGIELVNMIKKGPFEYNGIKKLSNTEQFYRMVT